MAQPHELYSIDSTTLASLGVTFGVLTDESEAPYVEPSYLERADIPGVRVSTLLPDAEQVAVFICPSWTETQALVRLLDWPRNSDERTIALYAGNPSSLTLVEGLFTVSSVLMFAGKVEARVRLADPLLVAQSSSTATAAFTANGNLAITNSGLASVSPTFTISPTSNAGRVGNETALIGWKYRAPIGPITNSSTEDWHEVLIPVWWGDTTPLTTAKAKADGSDVRIWSETGSVVRRQLLNWDTLATMIVLTVTIPAGETITPWVVYGNPQASTAFASDPEFLKLDTRGGVRDGYAAPDLYATTGVATGASTTTVVTISPSPAWEVDRLAGGWAWIVSGTGSGNAAMRRVLSNTASTYTVDDPYATAPDATSTVAIWMSGIAMEGVVPTAATSTTVTDSSKLWGTDQWQYGYAVVETGTGAGQTREVTGNTGTVITTAAWSVTPDTTSRIRLIKPGYQQHMVDRGVFDTSWRGLWRINNFYSSPERHWYGDQVPGGFIPFTRFQNEDNFAQPSANDYGSGGGHVQNWFPNGRIRRQVRQDRHYGEHKQADGFLLTDPRGIDGVEFDYQWKNVGGIAKFVFAAQLSQAESFMDLVTNSTTQASLTDQAAQFVNLTDYDDPVTTVAFNVGPADGVLIPNDTPQASEAELRTKDILRVWTSPHLIGGRDATYGYIKVGAEEEGWDANVRLKRDGKIVQVGGVGRHVMVPFSDDLVIRTGPDTVLPWSALYNPAATTVALAVDPFTAADGTALETYNANWVKHTSSGAGSATIDTNRVHNTNDTTTHVYYRSDWTPTSADYDVAADVVMRSDNNTGFMGVAGRIETAANTMYAAFYNTNGDTWSLSKVVAGVVTSLGTAAATLTVDQAYALRLVMRGAAIRVYVGGALVIAALDTAITAAGRAGVRMGQAATSTVGVHLDNWAAYQGGTLALTEWAGNHVRFLEEKPDLEGNIIEADGGGFLALAPGSNSVAVSETAIPSLAVSVSHTAAYPG